MSAAAAAEDEEEERSFIKDLRSMLAAAEVVPSVWWYTEHAVLDRWEPADDYNTFSYGVNPAQATVPVSTGFTYPRGYLPGFPEE